MLVDLFLQPVLTRRSMPNITKSINSNLVGRLQSLPRVDFGTTRRCLCELVSSSSGLGVAIKLLQLSFQSVTIRSFRSELFADRTRLACLGVLADGQ